MRPRHLVFNPRRPYVGEDGARLIDPRHGANVGTSLMALAHLVPFGSGARWKTDPVSRLLRSDNPSHTRVGYSIRSLSSAIVARQDARNQRRR
jgi:hypothetical protein